MQRRAARGICAVVRPRGGGRPLARLATRVAVPAAVLAALAIAPARADVAVDGVDDAQRANILAYLSLDEEPCDAAGWRVEQQYQSAPARIREALQALGYYGAAVRARLDRTEDCWHATFTVDPGEPVRIRTLDVGLEGDAANDQPFKDALADAGLKSGEILNQGRYEQLKRRWSDLARERGYADARLAASRIDVYPADHAADVALRFDSAVRYRFGDVSLQQSVLAESLVRSYLPFHAGDAYDARQLTALYVALADSGYFKTIDVHPLAPDRDTREIPVEVELTGAARRQLTYGVGFSTDTGPRFRFGRTNRRVNEHGHQFTLSMQLSPVVSELTANYRLPYGDPRKEWINFDTGLKREITDAAESDSLEIGARRVIERRGNWTRTQLLNFVVEDFTVADQSDRAQLLMPGIDWTRIRADNTIRPTRGSKLDLELRGAADAVLSNTSFAQIRLQGKWIWSPTDVSRILVRGDFGTTKETALSELPPSIRFFAGGDNSVRGYDFKALGPTDAAGEVLGGSSLAVGSVEYEHRVHERWSVALFVDSGNAFEDSSFHAKTGVGIGGRWQSPLGPIRIDLAHPVDDPTADRWRVHVSLGPDL